jgi:D-lactate dehydrogenase (cytochrome)
MGGTCTGEHGVGAGKIESLMEEAGESSIAVMKSIKAALDPNGILNPGKIFH